MTKQQLIRTATVPFLLLLVLLFGSEMQAMEFSLQILYGFQSPGPVNPQSGVVRTADGSFYGVTPEGGGGYGALYRIGPDGQLTVLTVFDNAYGLYPSAGLVMGNDGALYGAPVAVNKRRKITKA